WRGPPHPSSPGHISVAHPFKAEGFLPSSMYRWLLCQPPFLVLHFTLYDIPMALHFLGCFDAQQIQSSHQLRFHKPAESQQKSALLFIRFRQNVMLVVEIVERLRQLKRILRNKRGLLRSDRGVSRVIKRAIQQQQFPKV